MSSRDTFVTSYIYDEQFRDAVWDNLNEYAYIISDKNLRFVSGMIKNCVYHTELQIEIEIGDLIIKHDYTIPFNMVIISDDLKLVVNFNEKYGVI